MDDGVNTSMGLLATCKQSNLAFFSTIELPDRHCLLADSLPTSINTLPVFKKSQKDKRLINEIHGARIYLERRGYWFKFRLARATTEVS